MKKLSIILFFALSLVMSSCGQNRGKNSSATGNQTVESGGNSNEHTDELEKKINTEKDNYKWLIGVWAANDGEDFGRMIITDTYYQVVNSNINDITDKVENQPKTNYSIETRHNYYLDEDILCMDDWIGVDIEKRCPYLIFGENGGFLDLERVEGQTMEEAIEKANQPPVKTAEKIHGIAGPASYTWADENLNGRVKSYVEKVEKETHGGSGYCVTKKFDEKGNIVYYYSDANWILGYGIYPKGEDLPMLNDKGFVLNHNLFNPAQIKIAQASHNSSIGDHSKRNLDNIERIYKYDILGNITALYENNSLLYEFEYDDAYGRVTKLLENGKPIMKITWDYAYTIKFYSPEGYDAGEYKYAWKSKDVLTTIVNNGIEDYYSYPEYTFYDFPQLKTAVYSNSNGKSKTTYCYIYDEKGRLSHVVRANNSIELYNFNNDPTGAHEKYFSATCYTYKYNDKGDVCSKTSSAIYWPWFEGRYYNDFIDYIFGYNFNQLPADEKEITWHYVYDDYGNWTKREHYEVLHGDIDIENLQDITIREYVYYE